jgi:hypothetical protein
MHLLGALAESGSVLDVAGYAVYLLGADNEASLNT